MTNSGWPTNEEYPLNWLEYDWYSGIWEFPHWVTVRHGFGQFGQWLHMFYLPGAPWHE